MKSTGALKFIFVTIAAVILSGCQEKFTTEVPSGLNEKIEFILKEDAIYLQTASIRVKHNGSEDTQWVYMQTEDLTTDADQLISDRVKVESELTDQVVSHKGMNISINLKNLKAKQTYRLIVKAIDPKTGKLYGKVADFVFKTRRDPDVWEENANWSVSRKNERTQGIAEGSSEVIEFENFECVSSDEESYMVLTLSKDDYNNYKKDEHHQDKIRTIFEDYHADMSSLDNFEEYILKGNAVWKEQRLRSGDYVTYMIGVDKDGELSGLYKKADISIAQETPTEGYTSGLDGGKFHSLMEAHHGMYILMTLMPICGIFQSVGNRRLSVSRFIISVLSSILTRVQTRSISFLRRLLQLRMVQLSITMVHSHMVHIRQFSI
jgi:hypothetical protein